MPSSPPANNLSHLRRRRLLWACAAFILVLAGGFAVYQQHLKQREQRLSAALAMTLTSEQSVHIPSGASLSEIAGKISDGGAPVDRQTFIALAHRLNIANSLQAGHYQFGAGQSVEKLLQALAKGDVVVKKITFIEGRTFADIRAQLAQDARLSQKLPTMSDDDIREYLDISEPQLEGLFLPNTYFFRTGDSDLSVLKRAHRSLRETLDKHWRAHDKEKLLASPYEALILASIVEKETGKASERPLIASVFLNRLRAGIRLQADPTVIYGLGERFDGNLTRKHLKEDTAYNTYVHAGLTPTPIALAGEAAIAAVLNPPDTKYYYFVATGDGAHYFSKNLREHNNAVNRYQRRRQ